jgi:putative glutamine amidotransferase
MRRIGITQRVEVVEDYEERRDCLDQRWGPLLRSMGLLPIPLCNRIDDVAGYVSALDLDGFLLTGGNDIAGVEDASHRNGTRSKTQCWTSRFPSPSPSSASVGAHNS